MTKQFEAEQWLRELNHVYEEADWVGCGQVPGAWRGRHHGS